MVPSATTFEFTQHTQVEKERDDLYSKFVSAINEVQQKSGLKNVLLEKKLASIHTNLEKKEAQLRRVLAGGQEAAGDVTQRVDVSWCGCLGGIRK